MAKFAMLVCISTPQVYIHIHINVARIHIRIDIYIHMHIYISMCINVCLHMCFFLKSIQQIKAIETVKSAFIYSSYSILLM